MSSLCSWNNLLRLHVSFEKFSVHHSMSLMCLLNQTMGGKVPYMAPWFTYHSFSIRCLASFSKLTINRLRQVVIRNLWEIAWICWIKHIFREVKSHFGIGKTILKDFRYFYFTRKFFFERTVRTDRPRPPPWFFRLDFSV